MESILATAWDERLTSLYDFIVVGSSYGGAITAARLSNAPVDPKLKICLLERGQEWPIGSFPDTIEHVTEQTYNPILNPLGLYQVDVHTAIVIIIRSRRRPWPEYRRPGALQNGRVIRPAF